VTLLEGPVGLIDWLKIKSLVALRGAQSHGEDGDGVGWEWLATGRWLRVKTCTSDKSE